MTSERSTMLGLILFIAATVAFGAYRIYLRHSVKSNPGLTIVKPVLSEETPSSKENPLTTTAKPPINGNDPKLSVDPSTPPPSMPNSDKSIGSKDISKNIAVRELENTKPPERNNEAKGDDRATGVSAAQATVISLKDAKGSVDALYQAILWRLPDSAGGASAIEAFSRSGWDAYIGNARQMITSKEFSEEIVPKHQTKAIINRMYGVFLNRCSTLSEMKNHLTALNENDPGRIPSHILNEAIEANKLKIFEGGYDPESCKDFDSGK